MTTARLLMATTFAAFLSAGTVQAQTPEPEDRPATAEPMTRADRVDADRDDDFDLGWVGLVGLLGLAGLAGRRRPDTIERGPTVRTDRI